MGGGGAPWAVAVGGQGTSSVGHGPRLASGPLRLQVSEESHGKRGWDEEEVSGSCSDSDQKSRALLASYEVVGKSLVFPGPCFLFRKPGESAWMTRGASQHAHSVTLRWQGGKHTLACGHLGQSVTSWV